MGALAGTSKNQVVFVASKDDFEAMARNWLKDFSDLQFLPAPTLDTLIDGVPPGFEPKLVLLDGRGTSENILEWTQGLKMAFSVPLVVFYDSTSQLQFSILKKNGADSILHLYYDSEFIVDRLLELVQWDESGTPPLGLLNSIAVEDLSSEMDLNFDVYVHLPGNQKSILVRKKGTAFDQKLSDKVKDCQQNVYFKKTQMKAFLEYSRTALSLKNSEERTGITDKILRTRQRIQEINSQFFDLESTDYKGGKVILDNCEKIIEDLEIRKWASIETVVRNIILFSGKTRSFYNDVMVLCIFSAALAFLLEKKPEEVSELALAGLMHNMGLAFLSHPELEPDLTKLEPQSKKEYLHYPERSVVQIKSKKVPLPQAVTDLILQHREKVGGGGFPKGTTSDNHHGNSRIIQFAFILMELTQLQDDKPKHTIKSALNYLQEQMMAGNNLIDGTMLLTIKKKIDPLAS